MSKRLHEDSQSDLEPAAKRLANQNENEIDIVVDQKLQAARSALARLDYKHTEQICTELIDSGCCDPSAPLTLRSLNSEKQGYLASSLEDAKRALKLKESKKTHLRCSFAYLAHALHHLERAQKESEDDQEESYSVSEVEIQKLSHQLGGLKSLEDGKPFKTRVSEDLFLHMASFFDSPSLLIFSATSQKMRSCIRESTELFRVFKISGKVKNLSAGINFFSRRCGDSIKGIDIEVKNKLSSPDQELFKSAISLSASTLEAISICHQGELCKLIIQVASLSPSLKSLSSTSTLGKSSPLKGVLRLPNTWNVKLTKLIWKSGGCESLVCDDTLLQSLQSAKRVVVFSQKVPPSWVVALLSSASSTLVEANFTEVMEEHLDELPSTMEIPNLYDLRLGLPPRSRSTGDSLFKSLHAPNLRTLCLGGVSLKDLSPFGYAVSLVLSTAFGLLKSDGTLASEAGKEEATSLVKSIKNWRELQRESGFGECLVLPKLRRLIHGDTRSPATATPISAKKLAQLIGARTASWKGLSSAQVSSIQAGHLHQANQQPRATPFAPIGTSNRIVFLNINIPFEVDDEALSWLEKKVPMLYIKHRMAPKDQSKQDNVAVEP